ncbi:MAG: hypothetical protein MUF15_00195 [Acidobacteria bacterium]|jgi:shikimate dehydrogenase|nr:hypothetical protein [Acidobacteriota bacterium]
MIQTAVPSEAKTPDTPPLPGKKIVLAVTGNPVLHSKSPLIFNTIFQRLSINDSHFYTRIAANTPGEALFLFQELGLKGMNVTAPFKAGIMPCLDEIDNAAKVIGGVNTIVREEMGLKGYNTDFLGVTGALKARGIEPEGKRCIVLGAGGAGRAAVYGLLKEKALVTLINRTYKTALAAAKILACHCEKLENLPELLNHSDIFISTLPFAVDIVAADWLRPGLVVFDANYKKSLLIEKAEAKGCQVIRGEEWLLNQAIPAYRYFLGPVQTSLDLTKVLGGIGTAPSLRAFQKDSDPLGAKALKVIALVGFMGSGKTFIGKMLAQKLGLIFEDLDEQIEKKTGLSIPDIFAKQGEANFRRLESETLAEILKKDNDKGAVLACGGGVVLNEGNRAMLKKHCLVIWLYASLTASLKRIPRGSRPLLDCPDPGKEAQRIFNERMFCYAQVADLVVGSEGEAVDSVEKISDEIDKIIRN